MTKEGWIIFATLCVGILAGLIYFAQKDKTDVSGIDETKVVAASHANGTIGDHIEGAASSKVVLIEYGDFQCPGCGSAHPVMKKIVEKYKDKIAFVFRNYPLYTAHPNAYAAATAAESAGLQGKYWEMHNRLYENQSAWSSLGGDQRTDYFVAAASDLGLNTDQFKKDLDNDAIKKKIGFDEALGRKANLSGTPSFYLNGKSVGDQYVLDGKIVPKSADARLIWSDQTAFETHILNPALKAAGIALPE
jgi:protein-disulfide isomerase